MRFLRRGRAGNGHHAAARARWLAAFANAPAEVKAFARQPRPADKTHDEVVRRAGVVEADGRSQNNKLHTWRDANDGGFHGLDVLTRQLAGRNAAETFADCTGHVLMNNARDLTSFMANKGKMKYSTKRQAMDTQWGRVLNPRRAGESDDDEDGEDDEEAQQAAGGRWPWQLTPGDLVLYKRARKLCPTWACDSSGFRMPKDIVGKSGHLKIHDWMVLCGSMQAYFVGQFEGVTEEYKVLLSDYFYMLEVCYRFYCSYVRFDITCYRIALGVATQVLQGGRPRCAPGENRRHSV